MTSNLSKHNASGFLAQWGSQTCIFGPRGKKRCLLDAVKFQLEPKAVRGVLLLKTIRPDASAIPSSAVLVLTPANQTAAAAIGSTLAAAGVKEPACFTVEAFAERLVACNIVLLNSLISTEQRQPEDTGYVVPAGIRSNGESFSTDRPVRTVYDKSSEILRLAEEMISQLYTGQLAVVPRASSFIASHMSADSESSDDLADSAHETASDNGAETSQSSHMRQGFFDYACDANCVACNETALQMRSRFCRTSRRAFPCAAHCARLFINRVAAASGTGQKSAMHSAGWDTDSDAERRFLALMVSRMVAAKRKAGIMTPTDAVRYATLLLLDRGEPGERVRARVADRWLFAHVYGAEDLTHIHWEFLSALFQAMAPGVELAWPARAVLGGAQLHARSEPGTGRIIPCELRSPRPAVPMACAAAGGSGAAGTSSGGATSAAASAVAAARAALAGSGIVGPFVSIYGYTDYAINCFAGADPAFAVIAAGMFPRMRFFQLPHSADVQPHIAAACDAIMSTAANPAELYALAAAERLRCEATPTGSSGAAAFRATPSSRARRDVADSTSSCSGRRGSDASATRRNLYSTLASASAAGDTELGSAAAKPLMSCLSAPIPDEAVKADVKRCLVQPAFVRHPLLPARHMAAGEHSAGVGADASATQALPMTRAAADSPEFALTGFAALEALGDATACAASVFSERAGSLSARPSSGRAAGGAGAASAAGRPVASNGAAYDRRVQLLSVPGEIEALIVASCYIVEWCSIDGLGRAAAGSSAAPGVSRPPLRALESVAVTTRSRKQADFAAAFFQGFGIPVQRVVEVSAGSVGTAAGPQEKRQRRSSSAAGAAWYASAAGASASALPVPAEWPGLHSRVGPPGTAPASPRRAGAAASSFGHEHDDDAADGDDLRDDEAAEAVRRRYAFNAGVKARQELQRRYARTDAPAGGAGADRARSDGHIPESAAARSSMGSAAGASADSSAAEPAGRRGIWIDTVHAAKRSQQRWDGVILPFFYDGSFPSTRPKPDKGAVASKLSDLTQAGHVRKSVPMDVVAFTGSRPAPLPPECAPYELRSRGGDEAATALLMQPAAASILLAAAPVAPVAPGSAAAAGHSGYASSSHTSPAAPRSGSAGAPTSAQRGGVAVHQGPAASSTPERRPAGSRSAGYTGGNASAARSSADRHVDDSFDHDVIAGTPCGIDVLGRNVYYNVKFKNGQWGDDELTALPHIYTKEEEERRIVAVAFLKADQQLIIVDCKSHDAAVRDDSDPLSFAVGSSSSQGLGTGSSSYSGEPLKRRRDGSATVIGAPFGQPGAASAAKPDVGDFIHRIRRSSVPPSRYEQLLLTTGMVDTHVVRHDLGLSQAACTRMPEAGGILQPISEEQIVRCIAESAQLVTSAMLHKVGE